MSVGCVICWVCKRPMVPGLTKPSDPRFTREAPDGSWWTDDLVWWWRLTHAECEPPRSPGGWPRLLPTPVPPEGAHPEPKKGTPKIELAKQEDH